MNRFSYYRLPRKEQLVYCHLLRSIQNGSAIRMGPFDELNFASATQVTHVADILIVFKIANHSKIVLQFSKMMYTYLMMMKDLTV